MLVVDGATLLALAARTPASVAAAALLEEGVELAAPQAALTEALEGARRLARLGHMTAEDASALARILPPLLHTLAADAPLAGTAMELAAEHELSLPAALALALAHVRGGMLATVDARLAQAARQELGEHRVRLLQA